MLFINTILKKLIVYLFLCFTYAYSFAQQEKTSSGFRSEVDQLLIALESATDTNRIKILIKLCWSYKNVNANKAREYGEEALKLSQELEFQTGIASAYNHLGIVYKIQGNTEKDLSSLLRNQKLMQGLRQKKQVSSGAEMQELILNEYSKNFRRAIDYYLKSVEISKALNDPMRMASPLNNIASVYKLQKNYEKARYYYKETLKIYREINDDLGICLTLEHLGTLYEETGDFTTARGYFEQALEIAKKKNYGQRIAVISALLARIYLEQGQILQAEKLATQSLLSAREGELKEQIAETALILSKVFAKKKNFAEAFRYHQLYVAVKDSIYLEEENQKSNEMREIFDSEIKLADLKLKKQDALIKEDQIQLKSIAKKIFYISFPILCLVAFFFYRSNVLLQKANRTLKNKNLEIRDKNRLIEAKNESYEELVKQLNDYNHRLTDSIRYAERIQRAILPYEHELRENFSDYFAIYKPKDVVSGDFYWFTKVDNKLFLAVVDCTGHGVPGAFMSMIGNTLLNEIVNEEKIYDTQIILEHLHQGIFWALKQKDSKNSDGMDLALCRIDCNGNQSFDIQFSGAKSPLYYYSKGQLVRLNGDRRSVGGWHKETHRKFTKHSFNLEAGDTLYMLSDGFVDTPNTFRKKLGYKKLENSLQMNADSAMRDQAVALMESLYEHQGQSKQRDDITFIGIKL